MRDYPLLMQQRAVVVEERGVEIARYSVRADSNAGAVTVANGKFYRERREFDMFDEKAELRFLVEWADS